MGLTIWKGYKKRSERVVGKPQTWTQILVTPSPEYLGYEPVFSLQQGRAKKISYLESLFSNSTVPKKYRAKLFCSFFLILISKMQGSTAQVLRQYSPLNHSLIWVLTCYVLYSSLIGNMGQIKQTFNKFTDCLVCAKYCAKCWENQRKRHWGRKETLRNDKL